MSESNPTFGQRHGVTILSIVLISLFLLVILLEVMR